MQPSIKELRKLKADKKEEMKAITLKETDDAPLGDDDVASFEKLKEECDRLEARIARLTAALEDDGDEEPRDDDDGEKHWQDSSRRVTKGFDLDNKAFNITTSNDRGSIPCTKAGESAGRWLVAQWYVKEYGLNAAKEMVRTKMGDDRLVAKTMLTTSQPVIPQDFNPDWIQLLQAKSVVRQIASVYPMPNGNMTIPRQRLGSTGAFFAEGSQITVSQLGFDNIQMSWKKYGALTYTSRELLEFTPLNAAGIVADDLTSRLGLLEDRTFLYSTGAGSTPVGIIPSVAAANVIQSSLASSAVTFQTVSSDLQAAELAMTANFVTGPLTWIMAPGIVSFLKQLSSTFGVYPFKDEVSNGMLNGHPIKVTAQLATNLAASVAATTTALSTSSTTLTVPTAGVGVGWVISGTGISGTPTVASITSGSALVASAAQTVASGVLLTFTAPTSQMSNIILVKGDDCIIGDAYRFAISMTTEGSFIDSSTQVNTFGQDLVAFKATNAVDFALKHDVSAAVLQANNWSLNNIATHDFYNQAANTSASSASSASA